VAVYITEAHATDEWPISSARFTRDGRAVALAQPRTTPERAAAARGFVEHYGFRPRVLVDPVDNPFDAAFAPWPLRFYVLAAGRVAFKAQPKDCSYSVAELRDAMLRAVGEA
jgi:hypothetical protein